MFKKIIILFFIVAVLFNCKQEEAPKEILFICTHGAARSPIAAAYFNKLSKDEDVPIKLVKLQNQNDNPGSQHHVQQLICSKAELCLSILRLVVLLGNGVWTTMSGSGHVAAGIPDASQVGGRIPTTADISCCRLPLIQP